LAAAFYLPGALRDIELVWVKKLAENDPGVFFGKVCPALVSNAALVGQVHNLACFGKLSLPEFKGFPGQSRADFGKQLAPGAAFVRQLSIGIQI